MINNKAYFFKYTCIRESEIENLLIKVVMTSMNSLEFAISDPFSIVSICFSISFFIIDSTFVTKDAVVNSSTLIS